MLYQNMPDYQLLHRYERGQAGAQLLETLCYWFPMLSLEFIIDIILPAVLWPPGLTQPLTETSTRNIFWGGKGGRFVGLIILPSSFANCHDIWKPHPPGNLRVCSGLYRNCCTFFLALLHRYEQLTFHDTVRYCMVFVLTNYLHAEIQLW